MALCLDKRSENELRAISGNDRCVDCFCRGPQWASINFGVFMCLECSGTHRSLGVHISFVRSVTMDSWTNDQIQMMRTGGNDKCNNFLDKYKSLYKSGGKCNISSKYNSPAAQLYMQRIKAEVEGKPLPTELPKTAVGSMSASTEPINGETEEAYVKRQARQREEAQERLRQKFGKSTGLGGQGSAMQGIGSDANYRPGNYNDNDSNFSLSLADIGITSENTNKLKDDASKALETTWSFLGAGLSKLGEAANSVASNVVDSAGSSGQQQHNNGGGGAGRNTGEEDPLAWMKAGAFDLWNKASAVTNDMAKQIQGSDEPDADAWSKIRELQGSSTGKMSGVNGDTYGAPQQPSIQRSVSNSSNSYSNSIDSNSRNSSNGNLSNASSSMSSNSSRGMGVGQASSSNGSSKENLSSMASASALAAPVSVATTAPAPSSRAKKMTPPPSSDDFFSSFDMK